MSPVGIGVAVFIGWAALVVLAALTIAAILMVDRFSASSTKPRSEQYERSDYCVVCGLELGVYKIPLGYNPQNGDVVEWGITKVCPRWSTLDPQHIYKITSVGKNEPAELPRSNRQSPASIADRVVGALYRVF